MENVNEFVINLIKTLYDNYNGRPMSIIPSITLHLELLYNKANFVKLLNLIIYEISELNNLFYKNLSTIEDVVLFMESNNHPFKFDDNLKLAEELLVLLMSNRIKHRKRLINSIDLTNKEMFATLPEEESILDQMMGINDASFDIDERISKSYLNDIKVINCEMSKDYEERWHRQLDRFYSTLHAFISIEDDKKKKQLELLLNVVDKWRTRRVFKRLEIYDLLATDKEGGDIDINVLCKRMSTDVAEEIYEQNYRNSEF